MTRVPLILSLASAAVVLAVVVLGCGHAFTCSLDECDTVCAEAASARPRESGAAAVVYAGTLTPCEWGARRASIDAALVTSGYAVPGTRPPDLALSNLRI